jgi:NAD(P)-dependent dehydrogenase (short-subunit alcohol dehydrogenase family)
MGLLDGKVAVISGVGPGLGRSLALIFAREGADLALASRSADALDALAAEVTALGRRAVPVRTDITSETDAAHLVEVVGNELGQLDVLVNNAFSMGSTARVVEDDLGAWRQAFEVNVIGTLHVTIAAVPLLEGSDDGSVVMINSQAARRSQPRRGAYSASKLALLSTARTLAGELGPKGVRVNTVVPGQIWGPPLEAHFADRAERAGTTVDEIVAETVKDMALRRIATSDEVANAALFLASPLASGITGQSIDVNGGNWFD